MDRVKIGHRYKKVPAVIAAIALPFIYLPILLVPFVAIIVWMTLLHLKIIGAKNIKPYKKFIPDWSSHRYNIKNQITITRWSNPFGKLKLYWMFNCTLYCPFSVGLFAYQTYLVKLVENWWCPFKHDKKHTYKEAAIDASFWHVYPKEKPKLHPDDRDNPMFTDEPDHKHEGR